MRYDNINGCRTIDQYVRQKLDKLSQTDRSFKSLFGLMFSEPDAILHERSEGYKIVKTTYAQARDNALERAAGLKRLLADAPYDAVVGIHMENSVEWIETFWAVLAAGFRPLLMNLRLDPAALEAALESQGAVAVIADKGSFPVRTILQEELPVQGAAPVSGAFGTEVFVMSTGTSSNVKICGYGAEEFSCLVSDSVAIVRDCAQIKKHFNGQLKLLTFLPFYHVFGLIAVYIWFAFFSRSFVHLKDIEPQTILNTIRRHQVTHIFAVPLFWERIYDQATRTIRDRGEKTWEKYQKGLRIGAALQAVPPLGRAFRKAAFREVRDQLFGDSVQFMITGGSPIRAEALAFFNHIGYHLANGYGMTEIGITSVELSLDPRQRNSGSVGKPMPSVSYRIDDSGELLVKGPSLAKRIHVGGKVTVRGDDWFHTGDLAQAEKGSYRILGRKDDLILLPNGEMLNPNLIEPHFLMDGIDGVCLIDGGDGQVLPTLLLAVKRGCTRPELERLQEKIMERLGAHKLDKDIRKLLFVPGSLLGETDFKVDRGALRRKYMTGALQALSPGDAPMEAAATDLEKQVRGVFAAVLDKDPATVGMDQDLFMDLGCTSLDYFALLSGLRETYGLPFPETEGLHTLRQVCEYIEGATHVH